MDTKDIITYLKDNPRATAKEIGASPVEMTRAESKKLVERVGSRSNGGRGRPSVEWAIPGTVTPDDVPAVSTDATASGHVPAPVLERVTGAIRDAMHDEDIRKITFIEAAFDGKHGKRDKGEWKMLKEVYDHVVAHTVRNKSGLLETVTA